MNPGAEPPASRRDVEQVKAELRELRAEIAAVREAQAKILRAIEELTGGNFARAEH